MWHILKLPCFLCTSHSTHQDPHLHHIHIEDDHHNGVEDERIVLILDIESKMCWCRLNNWDPSEHRSPSRAALDNLSHFHNHLCTSKLECLDMSASPQIFCLIDPYMSYISCNVGITAKCSLMFSAPTFNSRTINSTHDTFT